MEVEVEIPKIRKVVRLEVEADHSLDSILEVICKDLGLGRKESWSIAYHDIEISDYSSTIRQLGVEERDRFQLIEKARRQPEVAISAKRIEVSRRGYLKHSGAGIVLVAVVAAAGYGIYEATKPSPTTPTPTPTPTSVPTPTPVVTPTPTPTLTPTPTYIGGNKILFDETHNEYWESTIEQGYADLAEELRRVGFIVESLKPDSITFEKISQYNALAIAAPFTPPKSLTSDEISAIKQFVSKGGGLFLAALGWSWVGYTKQSVDSDPANQIGREFGITVNNDIIYDPTNNDGGPGSPLFHKFASHPITDGLNIIWGATPSSLRVFGSAQSIIWGDEDAYARGDVETYQKGSNPPLVAVAELGKGRVVYVASDGMFHAAPYRRDRDNLRKYDNLKFAINTFKWLSDFFGIV